MNMSSKTPKYILLPAHVQLNPRGRFSSSYTPGEPTRTVAPRDIFPDYQEVRDRLQYERGLAAAVSCEVDEPSPEYGSGDDPDSDGEDLHRLFNDMRAALEDLSDGQTRDGAGSADSSSLWSSPSASRSLAGSLSRSSSSSLSHYSRSLSHYSSSSLSHYSSSSLSRSPSRFPSNPPSRSPSPSLPQSSASISSPSAQDDTTESTDAASSATQNVHNAPVGAKRMKKKWFFKFNKGKKAPGL